MKTITKTKGAKRPSTLLGPLTRYSNQLADSLQIRLGKPKTRATHEHGRAVEFMNPKPYKMNYPENMEGLQ